MPSAKRITYSDNGSAFDIECKNRGIERQQCVSWCRLYIRGLRANRQLPVHLHDLKLQIAPAFRQQFKITLLGAIVEIACLAEQVWYRSSLVMSSDEFDLFNREIELEMELRELTEAREARIAAEQAERGRRP